MPLCENIVIQHASVDVYPLRAKVLNSVFGQLTPNICANRDRIEGIWGDNSSSRRFLRKDAIQTCIRHTLSRSQFAIKFDVSGRCFPGVFGMDNNSKILAYVGRARNILYPHPCSLIQSVLLNRSFNRDFGYLRLGISSCSSITSAFSHFFCDPQQTDISSSQYTAYRQTSSFKTKSGWISIFLASVTCLFAGFAGFLLIYFGLWSAQFPQYHWWWTSGLLMLGMIISGCAFNAADYFFYIFMK